MNKKVLSNLWDTPFNDAYIGQTPSYEEERDSLIAEINESERGSDSNVIKSALYLKLANILNPGEEVSIGMKTSVSRTFSGTQLYVMCIELDSDNQDNITAYTKLGELLEKSVSKTVTIFINKENRELNIEDLYLKAYNLNPYNVMPLCLLGQWAFVSNQKFRVPNIDLGSATVSNVGDEESSGFEILLFANRIDPSCDFVFCLLHLWHDQIILILDNKFVKYDQSSREYKIQVKFKESLMWKTENELHAMSY